MRKHGWEHSGVTKSLLDTKGFFARTLLKEVPKYAEPLFCGTLKSLDAIATGLEEQAGSLGAQGPPKPDDEEKRVRRTVLATNISERVLTMEVPSSYAEEWLVEALAGRYDSSLDDLYSVDFPDHGSEDVLRKLVKEKVASVAVLSSKVQSDHAKLTIEEVKKLEDGNLDKQREEYLNKLKLELHHFALMHATITGDAELAEKKRKEWEVKAANNRYNAGKEHFESLFEMHHVELARYPSRVPQLVRQYIQKFAERHGITTRDVQARVLVDLVSMGSFKTEATSKLASVAHLLLSSDSYPAVVMYPELARGWRAYFFLEAFIGSS